MTSSPELDPCLRGFDSRIPSRWGDASRKDDALSQAQLDLDWSFLSCECGDEDGKVLAFPKMERARLRAPTR